MPRTTVNLDSSVLRALKQRASADGKSLGDVISELVAPALDDRERTAGAPAFRWLSMAMGPSKVDLEDRDAVRRALGER